MGLGPSAESTLSLESKQRVLDGDVTLSAILQRLEEGQYQNVIVLTGAGVSVSAGIPDYRSPGTGLYTRLEEFAKKVVCFHVFLSNTIALSHYLWCLTNSGR